MHVHVLTLLLSLLMGLSPVTTALAHPRGPDAAYVVTVEDASGRRLRTFHQSGKTFVLGEYGTRYAVRVRNQTGRRVEAVITVDGRDVVSGSPGDYVNQRGYVIGAYDSVLVEGFRKSHAAVASFRFTNPGDAYSSRMGTPQHVGVIGVAVFPERHRNRPRPRPRPHHHHNHDHRDNKYDNSYGRSSGSSRGSGHRAQRRRHAPSADAADGMLSGAPSPAPAAESAAAPKAKRSRGAAGYGGSGRMESSRAAPRHNLGTRYGEKRDSQVHEVAFRRQRAARPERVIQLHYDDAAGLQARGIRLWREAPVVQHHRTPEPFPYNRFAPPPPR